MPSDLHLFSTPGENDIEWLIDACRPYLERKPDSVVAYLPLASLYGERSVEQAEKAFHGLGRIETINTETMDLPLMESILRRAALAYIPGGNTYLLSHRLHVCRLLPFLRKKLEAGLPLVAFSAGTVLCGPTVLTSNDLNMIPTTEFDGLNLTAFNFNVHYTDDVRRDNWLIDYHTFHDNPIILMADGAYVKIRGKVAQLVRGDGWVWYPGREKQRVKAGSNISLLPEA
jgi:dipeptidase E